MRSDPALSPFLRLAALVFVSLLGLAGAPAQAAVPVALAPTQLCRHAIGIAERAAAIPDRLMAAIAHVESARLDPATGAWNPWPWTINAAGQGFFYDTKAQAIAAVRQLQAQGVQSIDVGCMQVNLAYHPDAFDSLDAAFDPPTNARYAARFLNDLYAQTRDWAAASALYHSATPELGLDYARKVMAAWPAERRQASVPAAAALALAWSATLADAPGPVARAPAARSGCLVGLAAYAPTPLLAALARPGRSALKPSCGGLQIGRLGLGRDRVP